MRRAPARGRRRAAAVMLVPRGTADVADAGTAAPAAASASARCHRSRVRRGDGGVSARRRMRCCCCRRRGAPMLAFRGRRGRRRCKRRRRRTRRSRPSAILPLFLMTNGGRSFTSKRGNTRPFRLGPAPLPLHLSGEHHITQLCMCNHMPACAASAATCKQRRAALPRLCYE